MYCRKRVDLVPIRKPCRLFRESFLLICRFVIRAMQDAFTFLFDLVI